jgi:tetratricopeptide (TPR) repeat protein
MFPWLNRIFGISKENRKNAAGENVELSAAREEKDDTSNVDRYHILFRLQMLGLFGCVVIVLYAWRISTSSEVLRIIGVGLLAAGAALLTGFVVGFIFGVPRPGYLLPEGKADAYKGNDDAGPSGRLQNPLSQNTNLVEISDWLTKIIVGVGLVELKKILAKLGILAYYLGVGLRPAHCGPGAPCSDTTDSGQAAALVLILFYFALGFLFGYVWTVLHFFEDLNNVTARKITKRIEDLAKVVKTKALEQKASDLRSASLTLFSDGRLDDALETIEKAIQTDSHDGWAIILKARILKRQAMRDGVGAPERASLLNQAVALADQASRLLPDKGEPIYNKACYQALLGLKSEALGNLRSAFEKNPKLRVIVEGGPGVQADPDWDSLRQTVEFKELMDDFKPPNP